MRTEREIDATTLEERRERAKAPAQRFAVHRAQAATLHRLPERMLVDRARAESAAVLRSISSREKLTG